MKKLLLLSLVLIFAALLNVSHADAANTLSVTKSGTGTGTFEMTADKTAATPQTLTLGGVPEEGNLEITAWDNGSIGVKRFISGEWQQQIYGWCSKGSRLQINGDGYAMGGCGSFVLSGDDPLLVSFTKVNDELISTVWTAGGVRIIEDIDYEPGAAYFGLRWKIINESSSSLSDLRFFHGEDTYFYGNDRGAGFWDAPNNTVGVQRHNGSDLRRMSLQTFTVPFAYDSMHYFRVKNNVNAGALTNTLDTNENTDNGYALEWRKDSLADGEIWTITAYEKFADVPVGTVSVTAPTLTECNKDSTCDLVFTVTNLSPKSKSVSLDVTIDQSEWTAAILSPRSPVIIPGYGLQQVIVQVSVPGSAQDGTVAHVTLKAVADSTTASDTATVRVRYPALRCPDSGAIECLDRKDGGDESTNLVDGKPGILEYKFIANVKDTDGTPKYVRVFTTQRSNPKPKDFYGHDMSCSGDYAAGATCIYKTKFGPAYAHKFYLEAKMANETILRYPVNGTVKGPEVYLLNEYSMVGLPRDINRANLDGAKGFGTEWVYRYDGGDAGHYSPVSDAYPARTGEGYFLWNDQEQNALIELAQYPDISAAEYTYELRPGWNLISNPYGGNVRLEDIMVKQGNGTPVPWVEAISDPNRWLYQSLYYYNGIDWGGTYNHEEFDVEPFATLVPWMGYFIYLYDMGDGNDYSLVIPRSVSLLASTKIPVSLSGPTKIAAGWKMVIIAKVNNAENRLVIGQIADASDEQDGRYDVPAYLNGDIKAYFILRDKAFWNDIRKSCGKRVDHCVKAWDLFVESEKKNETIVIKWNKAGLPKNIYIKLMDVRAKKVTDMRRKTEYSYKNTGKRKFIVVMTRKTVLDEPGKSGR